MKLVSVVLATLIFSSVAFAQAEPVGEAKVKVSSSKVFDRMDRQVELLNADLKKAPSKVEVSPSASMPATSLSGRVVSLLKQTDSNIGVLKRIGRNKTIPTEYAASINESTSEIEALRAKSQITTRDVLLLEAINEDIHIKTVHAQSRPNAPFDSIQITVRTKRDGQETGVYEVWWVKFAHRDDPAKYKTFDRFSSPTTHPLPPGKYMMWTKATDGSGATGAKTPKEFGDGRAAVDTDLIAP